MTVSPEPRTDPGRFRLGHRPALDGIRALAIVLVLANHTVEFPETGFSGVELFFVLSGFLITTLLLEEHARNGVVSFRAFYRRRALRLLPALVAFLAVFLAYASIRALVEGGDMDRALFGVAAGLGYFTNIALATDPSSIPSELPHLWSLAIEEQFYLVWPPVLFLLLGGRRRLALGFLAVVFCLAVLQQIRLYESGADWARIMFGTDTRSTSVVLGCILALAFTTTARQTIEKVGRSALPLVLAVFASLLVIYPGLQLFSAWIVVFGLCCAGLVVAALDSDSRFARVLSFRPVVFLGRISYALYLWHVLVLVALGTTRSPELLDVLALVLTFACAVGSYYLVELPFLRRKAKLHSREPEPPAPAAAPALSPS